MKARLLAENEKGERSLLGEKKFMDTERREVIKSTYKRKDPRIVMIDEFVQNSGLPAHSTPRESRVVTPVSTRSARKRLPSIVPAPPDPANGREYGVGEFLQIMSQCPGRKRRKLYLRMKKDKLVKASESAVYRLYSNVEA